MTRVRRASWIAIAAVAATAVGTLVMGAQAYANQDESRCAPPAVVTTVARHGSAQSAAGPHGSWRAGALPAIGCRAWRPMHQSHPTFVPPGPRAAPHQQHTRP